MNAEKSEPKDMFSTLPNDNTDFFVKHNSFRGGATDFAQKYLFKATDTPYDEDNIDILSHHSEEDSAQEDSCDDESYQNETSQGTLDQNELTHQLTLSSQEKSSTEKKCKDMIFTCCDWDNCRGEHPEDLEDLADFMDNTVQK